MTRRSEQLAVPRLAKGLFRTGLGLLVLSAGLTGLAFGDDGALARLLPLTLLASGLLVAGVALE